MSEHEGHRERLRERYLRAGIDGLNEHEVLELMLTYAIPRRDTKPIAKALIERFGSIDRVLKATAEELSAVDGMGPSSAVFLTLFDQVWHLCAEQRSRKGSDLSSVTKVKEHCMGLLSGYREELLYVLCLNPKLELIAAVKMASGTVNGVTVAPRQVAEEALRRGASGVVLAHNHPSGNPSPSREDIRFTTEVRRALEALSIPLYDHIVVGDTATSLKENGVSF